MSKLADIQCEILEKLALKLCGEEGKKLVKHHNLIDDVIYKIGTVIKDDKLLEKLNNCTDDELGVINSRLTMIINTLKDKEVK